MFRGVMDEKRCQQTVREEGRWPIYIQCKRAIWKDGFCKQHHPDTVKERREKIAARWTAQSEWDRKKWALQSAAPVLLEAAVNLLADVRRRYPGEELKCPYMIALDEAVKKAKQ